MLLADAEKLAKELMAQFGLSDWIFEFDNGKRRFGSCLHNSGGWRAMRLLGTAKGRITLSREMTPLNDRAEVEDTIRHEIAHALAGHKAGHGPEWKGMCKRTGAKPVRCFTRDTVNAPKGDWQAACGVCGRIYSKFREPRGDYYCPSKECKRKFVPYVSGAETGRFHPARKLVFRHKDAITIVDAKGNTYTSINHQKAIEAMKAKLKAAEQELPVAASNSKATSEPELIYQCGRCDRKSISFHVTCPVCEGDMVPEKKLQAEKEELKKRIEALQAKIRGQ